MKRTMLLAPALCFSLATGFGCSNQDNARRHEQSARDDVAQAQHELAEGHANARDELNQKTAKANDKLEDARKERAAADEDRLKSDRQVPITDERQPVAGHDFVTLESSLRDKLGDDWAVTRSGDSLIAERKQVKRADTDLGKKIDDKRRSIAEQHNGIAASWMRHEVILEGRTNDCDDISKSADDFAGIDGVNRIVVRALCFKK